jgi:hypothetical protein
MRTRRRIEVGDVFRAATHASSRTWPGGRVILHVGGVCESMQKERTKSCEAGAIYLAAGASKPGFREDVYQFNRREWNCGE